MFKTNKRKRIFFGVLAVLLLVYWFSLPSKLFHKPTSTVILSEEGQLLGARIAKDGQWRFPHNDSVPEKFKECIVNFEDQHFYYHPGVNIGSLVRAAYQDIKAGKIVSGGSTLSMQLIRLSKDNPPRNIYQKIKEIILATRLEISYSKDEILNHYAANAPFGSNVVGLEAASWRFFGRQSQDLSWAEAATLAVLPNAPSLIYPGKNAEKLLAKRNRLLEKLLIRGKIDSLTYDISLIEPLPGKTKPLPSLAPHLLEQVNKEFPGQQLNTTIDYGLQNTVLNTLDRYTKTLQANKIYNAAIIVLDVESGDILSYVGNTKEIKDGQNHGNYVDVIQAKRSSGSILKPFLYAYMIQEGMILPRSLLSDIPTEIAGYQPENFNHDFEGVVPANEALQKSLNIPAVRMLKDYGYPRFYLRLKELGLTTIDRSADNYGLALILGAAEVKLWDLATVYGSMARVLNNYQEKGYNKSDWHSPYYIKQKEGKFIKGKLLDASSIWTTFDAMQHLNRPANESGWNLFSSTRRIAWKTGTSHGFRDAWGIGMDSKYLVGVWVGNADGEGRPGITGISAAAPLLFQVFDRLPAADWFQKPELEMMEVEVCKKSGYKAGSNCPNTIMEYIHKSGEESQGCPFHKLIHLDKSGQFQVTSDCESVSNMQHKQMFVLPPVQSWYYKQKHPEYSPPPPFRSDCVFSSGKSMEMIYPKSGARIFIPTELSGERGAVVFELAHKQNPIKIYWHLDNEYLGYTNDLHQMNLDPPPGKHKLTLVDENGEQLFVQFWVME